MELVHFIIYLFEFEATSGRRPEKAGRLDFCVFGIEFTSFVMFDSSIYISCQMQARGMMHRHIGG